MKEEKNIERKEAWQLRPRSYNWWDRTVIMDNGWQRRLCRKLHRRWFCSSDLNSELAIYMAPTWGVFGRWEYRKPLGFTRCKRGPTMEFTRLSSPCLPSTGTRWTSSKTSEMERPSEKISSCPGSTRLWPRPARLPPSRASRWPSASPP